MKHMIKKNRIFTSMIVLALCFCALTTTVSHASTIYDINEDEVDETKVLSAYHYTYYDCTPYLGNDEPDLYLRLYNYDDANIEVMFADETANTILDVQETTDSRPVFYWEELNENHVYRIYVTNRSDYSAEVRVRIF